MQLFKENISYSCILYSNRNPMWNSGNVIAIINGQVAEDVFVDYSDMSADELIEQMKSKYRLNIVKYDEVKSQR